MSSQHNILIAGLGGASLGTEIGKCLRGNECYRVIGCDVSPYAYGHYERSVMESFVVDREHYFDAVLQACRERNIAAIVPGGEEPLRLLTEREPELRAAGIHLAANTPAVARLCSDKGAFFSHLAAAGWTMPATLTVRSVEEARAPSYPCILKPSIGSGGSSLVFLAESEAEMKLYASYILRQREAVVIQEYIPEGDGEFTIGVLHLPDGSLVGSVVLRRLLHAKLSVAFRSKSGVISSGYSQGLIDDFPALRAQAVALAELLGSRGPMNIQARVRGGKLIPFEVNPRFSASTYLRAMAGFNEITLYLGAVLAGERPVPSALRVGYYLRSLSEAYVPLGGVLQ